MNILINQQAGIGDIFFCQKIAVKLLELGHVVYWPLSDEYSYVKDYIINDIIWEKPIIDNFNLELTNATSFIAWKNQQEFSDNILYAKYRYANMHFSIGGYEDWKDYFNFQRNLEKENELFSLLGLEGKEYSLVNSWFASPPLSQKMKFSLIGSEAVEMDMIEGFTLFDWCKVVENADAIYTTDCALALIVEKLKPMKPSKYVIILRQPNIKRISGMYNLDWEYVNGVRG